MALSFGNTKGKAIKETVDSYTYADGEQTLRIFGGILPRYLYWLKGTNDKSIPVECLAFSREEEKFNNAEVDWVPKFFPEIKCQWSYSVNCIDPRDGKTKVLNLKKKLFEQIVSLSEDLGADPTDPDKGFDIVFRKNKTGPLPYNVEYTLSQIKSKIRALTDAEKKLIEECESIDTKYKRPTPEHVKELMERLIANADADAEDDTGAESASKEAAKDLA